MRKRHARKANTSGFPSEPQLLIHELHQHFGSMAKMETARINGVDLFYVDRGEGPSVLFVYESNVDYRIWAEHSEILAPRYRRHEPESCFYRVPSLACRSPKR